MNKMKTIILATALTVLTFGAVAEELSLEDRVSKLEDKSLGLSNGFFINGEIEGYYDDKIMTQAGTHVVSYSLA